MSIDFDSAALQTQHDDEEYDQEDYAREQELHKLLTDLPDDMLEDSRDSSSPELECSTCSNKNTSSSPKSKWIQQWPDHTKPISHAQNYEGDYDEGAHEEYVYEREAAHFNGYRSHPQNHTWNRDEQFAPGDYTHTSMGAENCTETSDFSTGFEAKPYPGHTENPVEYNGEGMFRDEQCHEDHNTGNHIKNFNSGSSGGAGNQYKASYSPHHPAHQQNTFNTQPAQQDHFEHLQREFLDTTHQNADREQLAQMQVLNKAQQRQIEDLERKLEDSRRNTRYIEHQFAIVKDEKSGLTVSLKESRRCIEEAKEREVQMENELKAMEQQVQILNEKDQENMKKQRVAEAAIDSMKQQMLELCRSDTLSKARQQHDRDVAIMKEQHEAALLLLQQKLDSASQAFSELTDANQKLQERVKSLEHQREEDQLERARVVNSLSQRLEESQQQCAKLLETNSVQEMSQMQIKLQQAQSAKALSENINKVLQEDMIDLKEQITLYESAVKHGVIALDLSSDCENHLSESCMDLGLKKITRKNGTLHSPVLAQLSDSKLPKDEALRLLRVEMQRCLGCLKGKRQKISQLQEELQRCQAQVNELKTEVDEAKLNSSVKDMSQMKHLSITGESQNKLMEDKQHLQEQVELLQKKNKELKQSEEKLKSVNSELCTKMREMIQELDQEKQEAAERAERIHQQYRDDVVNRVRAELMLERDTRVEQLTAQHQQQVQQLQNQLLEANDKMLAVQECYLAVCKEKSLLEERLCIKEKEEALIKEESSAAVEKLRGELEAQHQASIIHLKAVWSREKEAEIQELVNSHEASAEAKWKQKLQTMEKTCVQKLEDMRKARHAESAEVICQTDETEEDCLTISELSSRLSAQKQQLQLEADKVRCKAVEEARKQVQRELQEKHLEDIAKQVEGAVTRAYNRWIEDLSSLPEYQASLQAEKEKWEKLTEQRVSQALKDAEEQWFQKDKTPLEEHRIQKVAELEEEVASLNNKLEQATREQAALLKAELAGARAAWNRDKQKEISLIKASCEQAYQTKLLEQHRKLEQARQQVREEADLQMKELLLQTEDKLQQTVRAREEDWRCQYAEKELTQRQQMTEEFLAELEAGLAEVYTRLLRDTKTEQQGTEDHRRTSASEAKMIHIIQASCKDMVNRAVSEAKLEWKKMSEEKLSCALKEAQEVHAREMNKMQSSLLQRKEQSRCRKECTETLSKLQKKNQELQRHLEKACRQLQHSVREHKTTMQQLKDEHEKSLRKTKEEHLQQLEEVRRNKESSAISDHQQNLHQGLEEMKQQYVVTVEKIRGDMLRYLQESRERAAEMIRIEVQRERQDTARKMRRYYLTCLQELLEDGGKTTGAEKKIMNAASKLAAMAKVLETPSRSKTRKNYALPSCSMATSIAADGSLPSRNAAFSKNLSALSQVPDIRPEERAQGEKTSADSGQKTITAVRSKLLNQQDALRCQEESAKVSHPSVPPYRTSYQTVSQADMDFVSTSVRGSKSYLQEGDSSKDDSHLEPGQRSKPLLVQEAPVRDEKQTDWRRTRYDSDVSPQVTKTSNSGRKAESAKPFSAFAASTSEMGEFGGLTPDVSDITVYNEISKMTSHTQVFLHSKTRPHREPTPGSEGDIQQGACSRPLFSELRQRQQDSGFDSPFYQQQ